MKRSLRLASLVALLALSGCQTNEWGFTHSLWTSDSFRSFCEPAPNPELQLSALNNSEEIFVRYNEVCESSDRIKPRIYSLRTNLERVPAGKRPVFISPKKFAALQTIPLPHVTMNQSSTSQVFYRANTNGTAFTIFLDGQAEGPHELPVYQHRGGRPTKVLLTPLAIAGDAVIVGSVFGFFWLQAGGPAMFFD